MGVLVLMVVVVFSGGAAAEVAPDPLQEGHREHQCNKDYEPHHKGLPRLGQVLGLWGLWVVG